VATKSITKSKKTKMCIGCFTDLPFNRFNKHTQGKYKLRARCKSCFALMRKGSAKRMAEKKELHAKGKRRCSYCRKIKPVSKYQPKLHASGNRGYEGACKPCVSIRQAENHKQNHKKVREFVFNYLLQNPCIDCGETNVLALEFDHLHSKKFNIGTAVGNNLLSTKIKSEIKKCVIRCSSCHRIKTHQEQNSWRYRLVMERSA
jgi:hypothetical protein